jgi:gamma-glutamylcyclotransferase
MAIVFQYGSNCSTKRLNGRDRLNGVAIPMGIAETVEDYALAFDVWSDKNGCAASTIVKTPGKKAWGVLFDVPDERVSRETSPKGKKSFDAIEGDRYRRHWIQVRRSNGSVVTALTYVAKCPEPGLQTNLDYVGHIVLGLREHGVPEKYIHEVKVIAAANNPEIAEGVEPL